MHPLTRGAETLRPLARAASMLHEHTVRTTGLTYCSVLPTISLSFARRRIPGRAVCVAAKSTPTTLKPTREHVR